MLPKGLIAEFWQDVTVVLKTTHSLGEGAAMSAVAAYRELVDSKGIGDLTYHRDAEAVAETIADGWKSGFLSRPVAALETTQISPR